MYNRQSHSIIQAIYLLEAYKNQVVFYGHIKYICMSTCRNTCVPVSYAFLLPPAEGKGEFDAGINVHTHYKSGLFSTDLQHRVLYYITSVELLYDSVNYNSCLVQYN